MKPLILGKVNPFSLLIKPVGSRCNLNCRYCFYLGNDDIISANRPPVMPDHILEKMIGNYLDLSFETSVFTWQGGEPTLAGLDFYRRVVELQMKYGRDGQVVANALQTNGILIDDTWAEFLAEYRFLVGLSLDGTPEIHDSNRVDSRNNPTFNRVVKAAETLRRHGVEFNILCMISDRSETHGEEIYRRLTGMGFDHLQFIPCVEHDQESGVPSPHNVSARGYGQFMSDVFDRWYEGDVGKVSVRTFESLVALLTGSEHLSICNMRGQCHHYLVVEKEGDVYPCDFFVSPESYIGNICETPLEKLFMSGKIMSFSRMKSDYPAVCLECSFLSLCRGGCPKDRFCAGKGKYGTESAICEGMKLFFSHTRDRLGQLAGTVRQNQRTISKNSSEKTVPVSRNDPCPCGSGKKFKKCCMQ
ncbi:anaerobic sulfatase maturase [Candidatus Latescibacterota bacterium]